MNGQVQKHAHVFFLHFDPYSNSQKDALPYFNISTASLIKATGEISLLKPSRCFQSKEDFPVNNLHVPEGCCLELQKIMAFLKKKIQLSQDS